MGSISAKVQELENEDIICDSDSNVADADTSGKQIEQPYDESDKPSEQETGPSDLTGLEDPPKDLNQLIEGLPENFPKALPVIKSEIAPQLIELEGGLLEYYIDKLRKQTNVSKQTIKEEIKATKNTQDSLGLDDIEDARE